MIVQKACLNCNKSFERQLSPSNLKKGAGKYCCSKCCIEHFYVLRNEGLIKLNLTGLELGRQQKGVKRSSETRKKISISLLGKLGELSRNWQGGKPNCKDCDKEISYMSTSCNSCAHKGDKTNLWKGGAMKYYAENEQLRKSTKYLGWRKNVFTRDDYTCQICNSKGGMLQADHKVPWAISVEKRFDVFNGITMCKDCHALKTYIIDSKFLKQWLGRHN